MPTYCPSDAVSSWVSALHELFPERVPDMLEQLGIARRLPHPHRIARPCKVHFEHVFDLAGMCGKQDDAVGEGQGFAEVMRHEQDRLLLAFQDTKQHLMHVDFVVCVERTE